jgi:hypothetical protein
MVQLAGLSRAAIMVDAVSCLIELAGWHQLIVIKPDRLERTAPGTKSQSFPRPFAMFCF